MNWRILYFQVPASKLAAEVLEEVPDQLAGYYNGLDYAPLNFINAPYG